MARRTLILVRHGHASPGAVDADRPLDRRGQGEARALGLALAALVPAVDQCASSDARRTRQTAAAILDRVSAAVSWADRSLYLCAAADLIDLARGFEGETGIIVGHEPSLSLAVLDLCGPDAGPVVDAGVATGTAVVMTFDGRWEDLRPGCARAARRIDPAEAPR
ncbi:histidine phosphatase family protein [Actinomyces sp. B33]|uniref:SixA phosphatase family protein n=1 Tax=Actinomyces sp. B33 TaxID=2942131 RepID=UPI0023416D35|nr:histidine phosphatase family protein [Actinomyces sp. B33]MDC4233221.1 histidine phosphatase family protein [Actinomyces sp. B33]